MRQFVVGVERGLLLHMDSLPAFRVAFANLIDYKSLACSQASFCLLFAILFLEQLLFIDRVHSCFFLEDCINGIEYCREWGLEDWLANYKILQHNYYHTPLYSTYASRDSHLSCLKSWASNYCVIFVVERLAARLVQFGGRDNYSAAFDSTYQI